MKQAKPTVQKITAEETYHIRQKVLRPGRPLEEAIFQGDTAASTIHLGAFVDGQLLGVTSFMKNGHPAFQNRHQFQMRGMAVLPQAQGMGVGKELLLTGENLFKLRKDTELLWFNARESAVHFYEKFGYVTHGDFFEIPNVCTHIVMYKLV